MTISDPGKNGLVLRIEHASIYDGEGIRTVVFMKGCPLGCLWCSTPESQCFDVEQAEGMVYGKTFTAQQIFDEVRKDELFFFHSGGGVTFSGTGTDFGGSGGVTLGGAGGSTAGGGGTVT